jgi:hypothetical protein
MAATILVLGSYLLYPIIILLIFSFNTARDILVGPATWGYPTGPTPGPNRAFCHRCGTPFWCGFW